MRKIFLLYLLFIPFLFISCVTTGFKDFYTPWYNDDYFPEAAYLRERENPEIIKTSNIDEKFREIASHWYWCIGSTGFNGADLDTSEIDEALRNLCKEKKARLAIWSKTYTDTRSGVYSVPHTNYHSYTNSLGYTSSYTTTSYSSHSYSIQRYDFTSYLFVPIPDDYKMIYLPGFSVSDLTQHDRDTYKQNTGCIINIVYKDTVAYYANLFHGDIITKINGKTIFSVDDFMEFKKNSALGDTWSMTVIRNGQEKQINLIFGLY